MKVGRKSSKMAKAFGATQVDEDSSSLALVMSDGRENLVHIREQSILINYLNEDRKERTLE